MAQEIDEPVTRAEFDALKSEMAAELATLHTQHLAILALMRDSHEREKQALLATSETFNNIVEHHMGTLLATVVETIRSDRETHQPVHIN